MPPAIAMRWASRCRRDCLHRCSSRWRIRCLNSFAAMRARMDRSRCAKRRNALRSIACQIEDALHQLAIEGRVLEGGFRPGGLHREWCDAEILRQIRRKSLARLRREVEPVEQHTLARFLTHWQGLLAPRRMARAHLDALLDAIESLQGAPLPASLLESSILPARVAGYEPAGLDTLIAAGEVAWAGVEPLGERDGRIALFLADKLPLLARARPASSPVQEPLSEREEKLLAVLESTGASFFDSAAPGGGRRLSGRDDRRAMEPCLARA